MRFIKFFLLAWFTCCISQPVFSQLRLPSVLSSGMVLQQHDSVTLWGWAVPSHKIFVTGSWNGNTDSAVTTNMATWRLKIKTPGAGGPYSIVIKEEDSIVLKDILIGEVWLCSGQSNMEMNGNWGLPDIKAELPFCSNNNIRFFKIPKTTSSCPQDNCSGSWVACDSNTLMNFSAVGYFFGKKINEQLNVPVGLISSNWGGTPAETWTPEEVVKNDGSLQSAAAKQEQSLWWPVQPGVTYNAMIAPVSRFNIAGAIWYQGESNTAAPLTYTKLFTAMIDSWRKAWQKDLPFYYVQIAPFIYDKPYAASLLREQQEKAMQHPNVGMAVITDLVDDTTDIHPKNKHGVGYRLANWALAETYHKTGIVYKSPFYSAMKITGSKAVISFLNAGNGLVIRGDRVNNILIAASDKIFYPADAKITGDKMVVWSKNVKQPAAVRYSFSNAAIGNLFNKEGLPVAPFRTDDW